MPANNAAPPFESCNGVFILNSVLEMSAASGENGQNKVLSSTDYPRESLRFEDVLLRPCHRVALLLRSGRSHFNHSALHAQERFVCG